MLSTLFVVTCLTFKKSVSLLYHCQLFFFDVQSFLGNYLQVYILVLRNLKVLLPVNMVSLPPVSKHSVHLPNW